MRFFSNILYMKLMRTWRIISARPNIIMRIQLPIEKNIRWKYKMSSRFSSKKSRRTIYWLLRSALSFEYNAKISCTKHNFVCELLHLFSLFFFLQKRKKTFLHFTSYLEHDQNEPKRCKKTCLHVFNSCFFHAIFRFRLALFLPLSINAKISRQCFSYVTLRIWSVFFSVFFFSSWNFFQLLLTIIACVKQRKLHFFSFISFCFFFFSWFQFIIVIECVNKIIDVECMLNHSTYFSRSFFFLIHYNFCYFSFFWSFFNALRLPRTNLNCLRIWSVTNPFCSHPLNVPCKVRFNFKQ